MTHVNFWTKFKDCLASEDGAVTVDWVVLTSVVLGLGLAVVATIGSGATTYAARLNSEVEQIEVTTYD